MFKVIVPKATFKELEKIDTQNQRLIFEKIKDLEVGNFIKKNIEVLLQLRLF